MQLCYRGTKYQVLNNPIKTRELNVTARFLGRTYTLRQAHYQSPMPSELLKYRGIVYHK